MEVQSTGRKQKQITLSELFQIFVAAALCFGLFFQFLGLFRRFELQTINHRFEARNWFKWNVTSLARLNPLALYDYHENNEIPKTWWSWDYTLSWLIGDNHPEPKLKVVIFNRLLEDEPPQDAVLSHPWMKPLLSYPLPRETLSQMIAFIANSGARAIVLDYDFPQYAEGDKDLAQSIYKARSGIINLPVFMANTVHSGTANNINQLQQPVTRSGVIRELEKLEPEVDVVDKYTGLTGVLQDEDQVVRRMVLKLHLPDGKEYESVVTKLLNSLNETVAPSTPEVIDVDFITVPNSETFPVRPLSYLLDPELKKKIAQRGGKDVSLKDAIVIIGDGISDVYDTPLTNLGANRRSGAELLAQGLDTIVRQSWLQRVTVPQEYIFVALMAIAGGINFVAFRYLSGVRNADDLLHRRGSLAVWTDVGLFVSSLLGVYFVANILFSYAHMIVPLVVPAIAITIATLITILWERDRIRVMSLLNQVKSSQEKLILAQEKHDAQLAYQASLAEQRAMEEDRSRRHDMVRRLNHDLKAPISVFNWTLAKVLKDRAPDDPMYAVFQRLKKSSEHLSNLLTEILQSLAEDGGPERNKVMICEVTSVLKEQSELERSLAEITGSEVILSLPEWDGLTWVIGTELEIARIVDNIVGNALKHNPAGTRVEISMPTSDWNDEIVMVSIKDNGKGIAKDDLERIFQSGFRAGGTRQEGEGLGLSIAMNLATKIGGKIVVESEVGVGTRFDITFQRYKSTLDETSDIRLDQVSMAALENKVVNSGRTDDDGDASGMLKGSNQPGSDSEETEKYTEAPR
ncbi:CHASE2 domain-containing protein [Candidatus Obscuribacterales bacterium]|nr:CHASE2 domain-containing protein [Candidatus Obscuribacterales bacterium]